jgi:RimJ/RimL family protein N-acetyltransferase
MTAADREDPPVTQRELIAIHIATLFTLDANGRLLRVNEANGGVAPRFFLGRTPLGNAWQFRHDVDDDLVRALDAVCRSEADSDELLRAPYGATPYRDLLEQAAPVQRVEAGPAYRFPRVLAETPEIVAVTRENVHILQRYMSAWLGDVEQCQPFMAFVVDGHAASVCASVRVAPKAHEAGVDTHPEFRGRGYAPRVTTAWARAVRAMGRIPLYSTSWENSASRAVARKLGLVQYGAALHIT